MPHKNTHCQCSIKYSNTKLQRHGTYLTISNNLELVKPFRFFSSSEWFVFQSKCFFSTWHGIVSINGKYILFGLDIVLWAQLYTSIVSSNWCEAFIQLWVNTLLSMVLKSIWMVVLMNPNIKPRQLVLCVRLLSLFIRIFVSLICLFNALFYSNIYKIQFICFATCNAIVRHNNEMSEPNHSQH